MTEKAEFDAESWEKISRGPVVAALYMITAEKGGSLRESMAVGKVYSQAKEKSTGSALVDEIVASITSLDSSEFESKDDFRTNAMTYVSEATALLRDKAEPADVDAYRDLVVEIAQRVADADKSGSFLGIGGERVTAKETAALEEIRAALS